MDRNLILAIVLSVLIIVGFQLVFQAYSPHPATQPIRKQTPTATQAARGPEPAKAVEPQPPAEQPPAGKTPQAIVQKPEEVEPAKEARITVETSDYVAVMSSVGARLVSFKLKHYRRNLQGPELVNLFPPGGPDTSGPSITFTRRDERFNDSELPYQYGGQPTEIRLENKGAKKSITFRASVSGLIVAKTFTFVQDSYRVGFSVRLTNTTNEPRNYLITLPWKKWFRTSPHTRFAWDSAEILLNGELKDYMVQKIKGEEEPSGRVEWAGLGSVYFFQGLVFGEKPATKVTLFKPTKEGLAEIKVRYGAVAVAPGQTVSMNLALYLGPKQRDALHRAGNDLSKALIYSNYKVLEVPAEYLMKFLRLSYSGFTVFGIKVPGTYNYGVAIILLTIVIKILFIPLTHKSMKSMKKMQELQPQLQKLREKYKDNKEELNKATMQLFRDYKVSPLSGCWPMFVQLPVFVALYQALSYAIELRQASFICIPSIYLCLNDLSAPDPYYVTPILMGGTMVLQQWMTPSGGDPTQKKMMLLMPVVFTYLFLTFPSGLVLYWLVSNLLQIGQQLLTNKFWS
jgi:YidC/Oxa1 family membrane protein insertase